MGFCFIVIMLVGLLVSIVFLTNTALDNAWNKPNGNDDKKEDRNRGEKE